MMSALAQRLRRRSDAGFSLVEVLVAMTIAVTTLIGLLGASVYALQATVTGRQNQQAADYLNQAVENLRSADFASLTMVTTDLTGDPQITTSGGSYYFNPGTGAEPVYAAAVGAVSPHITTLSTSNGTYTLRRYITVPTGTTYTNGAPAVVRATVNIAWTTHGASHQRASSTIITSTRRGLPLPRYTFVSANSTCGAVDCAAINPGNQVAFSFTLTNLGARDSFTLSSNDSGWVWYGDDNGNGYYDATDTALVGSVVGPFEPGSGQVKRVFAVKTFSSTTGTFTQTFSATSVATPTFAPKTVGGSVTVTTAAVVAPTASASATPSPTASAASCDPGTNTSVSGMGATSTDAQTPTGNAYTLTQLLFSNGPALNDTTTLTTNTMSSATTLQPAICNFSTDRQTSQAGRLVSAGGSGMNGTAIWTYTPPIKHSYGGTASAVLAVQCLTSSSGNITASLVDSVSQASLGSGTVADPSNCNTGGFQRIEVPFSVGSGANNSTDTLTLTITTSTDLRIAYDATGYESQLTLAIK